jgi:hypothetical protein
MELSPSLQAATRSPAKEFPNISWNPKVYYRVYKSFPHVPILSQIIQSIPHHSIFLRSILILSTHLCLGLLGGLLPSGYRINILYAFLFLSIPAIFPTHLIPHGHSNYTWRRVQVMKLLTMQFSPLSCHFIPRSKYYPQHPVLSHPQSMFVLP